MKKFDFSRDYFMIKQSKNFWCEPTMSGSLDFYKRYLVFISKEQYIINGFPNTSSMISKILNKERSSESNVYSDGYKPGQYL